MWVHGRRRGSYVVSSTGRGPRLGGPDDFFQTPAWCVDRLLEAWHPPGGFWLDPGAGEGAIMRAVDARRDDVTWVAVESRAQRLPVLSAITKYVEIADFLACRLPEQATPIAAVLANPPFNQAFDFVRRAREIAPEAQVCMLLRIAFLATETRAAFMRENPPDVYVLPNRPSFTPDGKTDSADYAWFCWRPGARIGGLRVYSTSKADRGRGKRPEPQVDLSKMEHQPPRERNA